MGIVTIPQCDVFRTFKAPINEYRITVTEISPTAEDQVFSADKYLSNRGLIRLLAFVERGTTPPSGNSKKKKSDATHDQKRMSLRT